MARFFRGVAWWGGSDWRWKWCLGQKNVNVTVSIDIWWIFFFFTYLPTHYLEGRVAKRETNNFLRLASWLETRMFPKTGIILNARWNVTRMYWKTGTVVTLVEQERLTLPKHPSSTIVFSGVCVTRSLALSVCVVNRCLSFCPFSFGHCVVCPSLIYIFWLPL